MMIITVEDIEKYAMENKRILSLATISRIDTETLGRVYIELKARWWWRFVGKGEWAQREAWSELLQALRGHARFGVLFESNSMEVST